MNAYKITSVLSGHAQIVFKFLACLFENNYEVSVCFFETLTNFCSGFPCLSLVNFLLCSFKDGFRNNIQDHRGLSEQFLDRRQKAGTSFLKMVSGRIFTISK
jgi:hypothetical protein